MSKVSITKSKLDTLANAIAAAADHRPDDHGGGDAGQARGDVADQFGNPAYMAG